MPRRLSLVSRARRHPTTLLYIDFTIYKAINGFAYRHDGVEDVLRFVAQDAQYFFVALLVGLFFASGKWRSRNGRHGVVAAGFSAGLALAVAHFITDAVARPRPYAAHHGDAHLFIAPSHDGSFPSDHATASFAIAVAILLRHRRAGLLALAMATILAVARVAVGTHYPADVVAGALLGSAAALILWAPPIREPLHRLADWAGTLYDRALLRVARARPAS
jgi:undecaprenyl-diphosphatase